MFEAEHLARLVELTDDLICVGGADGRFHRVSPSWTRLLGWDEATLLERPFVEFIHPDDAASTAREMRRVIRGGRLVRFANRFRHQNGSYRWLRWSVAPSLDSTFAYAIARDITEAQELRARIDDQTQRLQATEHRLATEISRARAVQDAFLASEPLALPWVEVAGRCIASQEMSGDFLDWRQLASGDLAVSLGDVMGKGVAAALLMATTQALLRSPDPAAKSNTDPATRMDWINASLAAYLGASGRFVTAFHATCDRDGVLRYADAGHSLVAVRRVDGTLQELEGPGGLPLGLAPTAGYEAGHAFLGVGDVLIMATDGLRDVLSGVGHGDWLAHLDGAVSDWSGASGIIEDIVLWAESATLGAGAADDLSVLVLVYRGDGLVCTPSSEAITLPATPAVLARVERWVRRRIEAAGGSSLTAAPFVLAAHEVLANIIEHAQPLTVSVRLESTQTSDGLRCEAVFEDQGARFIAPEGTPADDGGRGLLLCRAALAEFEYERDGLTNRWRLVATLPSEPVQPPRQREEDTMNPTHAAGRGRTIIHSLPDRVDMATVDEEQVRIRALLADAGDLDQLVVRMCDVEFIDSSGIGMLVVLQRELQAKGARLALAEVPAQARMALRLTRLEWLLPAFASLEEALAA